MATGRRTARACCRRRTRPRPLWTDPGRQPAVPPWTWTAGTRAWPATGSRTDRRSRDCAGCGDPATTCMLRSKLPDDAATEAGSYGVHPALLDAALHPIGLLPAGAGEGDGPRVAFAFSAGAGARGRRPGATGAGLLPPVTECGSSPSTPPARRWCWSTRWYCAS